MSIISSGETSPNDNRGLNNATSLTVQRKKSKKSDLFLSFDIADIKNTTANKRKAFKAIGSKVSKMIESYYESNKKADSKIDINYKRATFSGANSRSRLGTSFVSSNGGDKDNRSSMNDALKAMWKRSKFGQIGKGQSRLGDSPRSPQEDDIGEVRVSVNPNLNANLRRNAFSKQSISKGSSRLGASIVSSEQRSSVNPSLAAIWKRAAFGKVGMNSKFGASFVSSKKDSNKSIRDVLSPTTLWKRAAF